jgi:hypothetical protein
VTTLYGRFAVFLLAPSAPIMTAGFAAADPIGSDYMVDYIGVSDIQRIVHGIGPGNFIERLAHEIEADFRRWPEFEKIATPCEPLRPSA